MNPRQAVTSEKDLVVIRRALQRLSFTNKAREYPTAWSSHGKKGDIAFKLGKLAICVDTNHWQETALVDV